MLIEKQTNKGILYEVDPDLTFFVAKCNTKTIKGGGLGRSGWDEIDDVITRLSYVLSNGIIINIPMYLKYLHLIEASMSVDRDTGDLYGKNYHYVFIKGFTGKDVVTHKITLRSFNKDDVGNVEVYKDSLDELQKYRSSWKDGGIWQ